MNGGFDSPGSSAEQHGTRVQQRGTAHGCGAMPVLAPGARSSRRAADLPPLRPQPCRMGSSSVAEKPGDPPGAPICFYSQLVPPRDEVTQKIWLFLGVLHFVSPGQAMPELSVHSCWQQALCKHTQTASRHDTSTSPSPCCSQRCCSTSDSPVAPAPCLCEPRAAGEAGC